MDTAHSGGDERGGGAVPLERLTRLAETLGTAREFVTVWRALHEFAEASVPCVGIFISLYDPERRVRTAVYGCGDGLEVDVSTLPPMPITSTGPNSRAVTTGQVVITNEDLMTVLQGVVVGPDNGLRPQSSLVVPMSVMGRVVGTVEVQSYERAAYGPGHVAAMRMAANLAAVAVENMRLLEREREARAAAEESNRLKDEFLATLSHELRTPLTAILGWASMLRSGRLGDSEAARAAEVIERNAQTQQQLVDDILDVSRIITGKLRVEPRPVELPPVVGAAVDAVRPAALAKRIEVAFESDPRGAPVAGDPDRLQQVVWNLLANAVKFTPAGGCVRVRVGRDPQHALLTVEDTGVGIEPDFLPYVFDRFRQGDQSTTRSYGGVGIGLSIVRYIVELHGGTVRAESAGAGAGSRFTVELPLIESVTAGGGLRAADEAQGAAGEQHLARGPGPGILWGLRVLAVEDDPDTLDLIVAVLRQGGAEVAAAGGVAEAVESFRARTPHVILSDIGMPAEDGYDLIVKVRALERESGAPETPAVALTAYAAESDRAQALGAGYQMHLPKPVDPARLVEAVAALARRADGE